MIQKIIVLTAIVAAVWYGFKFLSRLDEQRKQKAAQDKRDAVNNIADTVQCPVCSTYIAVQTASDCGKSGCPY